MINLNGTDFFLLLSAFIHSVGISTLNLCTFYYFRYEGAAVSSMHASAEHTIRITFMQ